MTEPKSSIRRRSATCWTSPVATWSSSTSSSTRTSTMPRSQLEAMRAAAAAGDVEALVRPVHSLKSSSANVGAAALTDACRSPGGRRAQRFGRRMSRRGWPPAMTRSRPLGTPCSRSGPLATPLRRISRPTHLAEPPGDIRVAGGVGQVGRRGAIVRAGRRVRTGGQEQLHHLVVAVLGRGMERRVAVALDRVHVRAGRQQHAADLVMSAGRRTVERLDPHLVRPISRSTSAPASSSSRAASALPKNAARWSAVKPSAETGVARAASDAEVLGQSVGVPEGGRFEDIEVRIGREQRVGDGPVGPIASESGSPTRRRRRGRSPGTDRPRRSSATRAASPAVDRVDEVRRCRLRPPPRWTSLGAATNIRHGTRTTTPDEALAARCPFGASSTCLRRLAQEDRMRWASRRQIVGPVGPRVRRPADDRVAGRRRGRHATDDDPARRRAWWTMGSSSASRTRPTVASSGSRPAPLVDRSCSTGRDRRVATLSGMIGPSRPQGATAPGGRRRDRREDARRAPR